MAELKNENAKKVLEYVVSNDGADFTAQDISTALGIGIKSVNGIVTMSFCRHKDENGNEVPLMEREETTATIDGKPKIIKYIRLTSAGKAFAAELGIQ
jgi:hypothetical protein